jgi:uncharacterized protein
MPSLDLPLDQLTRAQKIVREHVPGREVRAFGSRVNGTAKPMSDLDLCIMGELPLPADVLDALRSAFVESELPFKVDVVQSADLSEVFRASIIKCSAIVQHTA